MWNTFSLPQLSLVIFTGEIFTHTSQVPEPTSRVYKSGALLTGEGESGIT